MLYMSPVNALYNKCYTVCVNNWTTAWVFKLKSKLYSGELLTLESLKSCQNASKDLVPLT